MVDLENENGNGRKWSLTARRKLAMNGLIWQETSTEWDRKGIVSVITYCLTRHRIDVRMKWYGVEADFRRLNVVMFAVANLQMEKPILP